MRLTRFRITLDPSLDKATAAAAAADLMAAAYALDEVVKVSYQRPFVVEATFKQHSDAVARWLGQVNASPAVERVTAMRV